MTFLGLESGCEQRQGWRSSEETRAHVTIHSSSDTGSAPSGLRASVASPHHHHPMEATGRTSSGQCVAPMPLHFSGRNNIFRSSNKTNNAVMVRYDHAFIAVKP